ncbi:MAG TPA: histidinol-phosphatase HisJ family protein [bacterium]
MIKKLADYHIHTSFCNHANGTMREYVKYAITAGLNEIGFSDHNPLPADFDSHYRMQEQDLQIYLKIIRELQDAFPQIKIKIGIELDYIEGAKDYLKEFVSHNTFDYIIGSVHYLSFNSSHQIVYLNDVGREKKNELYGQYFELVEQAANSGFLDIIAHFDLPRRFWGDLDAESIIHATKALESIKRNNICIEINTSGFRTKNVMEPFPGRYLLEPIHELEIPITLGSDSHSPLDVGSYFHEVISLLKEIGFREVNYFTDRQRMPVLI